MLDDLERPAQMRFDVLSQLSGIPCIGPQVRHARKDVRQVAQEEDRARAVLDIRLMHLDRHHQTQRINKQMTLSSTDLLPTVITARAASFSGFHRLTVNDPGTGCRLAAFSLTQQFT